MSEKDKEQSAEVAEIAGLIASLDTIDSYGIPPVSIYQRFNSVGADLHGQCAVAQGAKGFGLGLSASFDFAKLWAPGTPLTLSASADVKGVRLPTSAVMLYRFPVAASKKNGTALPLTLAQMDGVSWQGEAGIGAKAGLSDDLWHIYASGNISVAAGAKFTYNSTFLVTEKIDHFSDSARYELTQAVDKILAVEVKKSCLAILSAQESWTWSDAAEIAKDVGTTGLATADAFAGGKIKELIGIAKDAVKDEAKEVATEQLKKGSGWLLILAGVVSGGVAYKKRSEIKGFFKSVYKKLFEKSDDNVLSQLEAARELLDDRIRELRDKDSLTPKEKGERETLMEARYRIVGFRNALFEQTNSDDHIFLGKMPKDTADLPEITDKTMNTEGAASISLTSFNYGAKGELDAGAKVITAFSASAHAEAGLAGRIVSFRLKMRGAGGHELIQDTKANFFQLNLDAALKAQILHTGLDSVDKRLHEDTKTKKEASAKSAGLRRYGALTYRSAMAYADRKKGTVIPGASGLSFGVSIRVARLCAYADMVRDLDKGKALSAKVEKFEKWTCEQLACSVDDLRTFVKDAPLGAEFDASDETIGRHKVGYPCDALIVETGFGISAAGMKTIATGRDVRFDLIDLFGYYSYTGVEDFQQAVKKGTWGLSAMRLRYRVDSPLSHTSKKIFPLGIPTGAKLPLSLSFDFSRETEVGQESIVDLYTRFAPAVESAGMTEHQKYEQNIPPVVLFNRV